MDKLARRVAANHAFKLALGDGRLPMPSWVASFLGSDKTALLGAPGVDEDLFKDARDSVSLFLTKFMGLLGSKYHDRYHMNATQKATRMHYYFATKHPLETFVLDVNVRGGKVLLGLHFIPHDVKGKPLLVEARTESASVADAELAGLTFMRLARKLLSRV